MSRSQSRSRSPAREVGADDWNQDMQEMFTFFQEYGVEEDEDIISDTIKILNAKGVRFKDQLQNCPHEVLTHYLPPESHGRHLVVVHCLLAKIKAAESKHDITAQAMRMMVKEQRAQRKKRQGNMHHHRKMTMTKRVLIARHRWRSMAWNAFSPSI